MENLDDIVDKEMIKKVHKAEKEILDEFVRICKKNNLQYFMIAGTLLGAVRHKGFIPWDDDVDVGMPRDDYEKFVQIAQSELKEKYELDCKETNPKYYLNFIKIRNKNTIYEQDFQVNYDGPKGIWIDIFPIDTIENVKLANMQKKLSSIIFRILHYKNGFILGKRCGIIKKIIGKVVFIKHRTLLNIQDKILKLQDKRKPKYMINLVSAYDSKKELFEKSYYLPARELEFEGDMYSVPNKYKEILTQIYGDYMKIPSKEQIKIKIHIPIRVEFEEEKK